MGKWKVLLIKLAWFKRKIKDPYSPTNYTQIEYFVPKPTRESPYPCILVSIRNGRQRLFFRVQDVSSLLKALKIPADARLRLKAALISADIEADEVEADMKAIMARRHGAKIVYPDTGEVLEDVNKYLRAKHKEAQQ